MVTRTISGIVGAVIALLLLILHNTLVFPIAAGIAAAKKGGIAPTAATAANEIAVQLFLDGRIGFLEIGEMVAQAVAASPEIRDITLDDVLACDREVRARCLADHT